MANLIQIAEELEYMPKDQLAQMTQDPNSTYPQFLVLSEIQRRTQLEKAYQAQATQAEPQTTVAEETVAEFMAPQGLQGMAQQPMPQDMPAPMPESPMQMMADGGRTGFYGLGSTSYGGGMQNAYSVDSSPSVSDINQDVPPDVMEEVQSVIASKGSDFLKFAGVLKSDGSIDPVGAAIAVASLHPLGRAAGWAGKSVFQLGKKYLPGLGKKLAKPFTNKVTTGTVKSQKGKIYDINSPQGKAILAGKKPPQIKNFEEKLVFDPKKTLGVATSTALPVGVVRNISNSAQEQYALDQEQAELEKQKLERERLERERLANQKAGLAGANTKTEESGLFSNITPDQGLTMAQLGGVLMGARNMSELGTGIAGVAGQMQERKSAAGLAGAQQSYYEAQAKEAEAKVANMKPQELISLMEVSKDMMKAINEGAGDSSQIADIQAQYKAAYIRYMELTGGEMPVADDPYAASGVKIT